MLALNEDALDKLPSPALSEEELKAALAPDLPVWAERGRKLTKGDRLLIEVEGGEHAPAIGYAKDELTTLTFRHHQVAKYLAAGMGAVEASQMSGYSPTRIHELAKQPLFQELVEHYERLEDARAAPVVDALTVLGMQAAQRLANRIEEHGHLIETSELRQIMMAAFDRAGHSPKTRHESISVTMTGQELAEIKAKAANGSSRGVVIMQQPGETSEAAPIDSDPAITD